MSMIAFYTQAYNSEAYISKCITSILNQTYRDFRYYIFDNGSTDNTWNIIRDFAKHDKRIVPVHLDKNSVGVLNKYIGMMSNEKYLATLDSDDWYEPDFAKIMIKSAEKENLDITVCGSKFHFMESNKIGYRKSDVNLIIERKEYDVYFSNIHQFFRPVWGKLFKMSLFSDEKFEDIIKIAELGGYGGDTVFSFIALEASQKIGIIYDVLHNYVVHNKSLSYLYNNKRFSCDVFLFDKSERFLKGFGEVSKKNHVFLHMVYINALIDTINVLLKSKMETVDKLVEIERFLAHPLTKKTLDYLSEYDIIKKLKKDITYIIMEMGQSNINNLDTLKLTYTIICLLFNKMKYYIHEEEMEKHLNSAGYILYMTGINKRELFRNNLLLEWIKDESFIFEYPDLIKDVYFNDYYSGLDRIIFLLNGYSDIKFEEEIIYMTLSLSAALKASDVFIYAKKLQTQLFLDEKRYEEAETVLEDLIEMCPNDGEVIGLKNRMEEEYD